MNKHEILTLIHFNFWANGRVLGAAEHLSPDAFTGEITPDPGWGTLRGVLVHILDTEFGWRANMQGQAADIILEAADFADVAALKARWDIEKAAWLDFVSNLTDEHINQKYRKELHNGPKVWQTMMHVIMHGHQHRGEAALVLTGQGHPPGELDFALFLKQHPEHNLAD